MKKQIPNPHRFEINLNTIVASAAPTVVGGILMLMVNNWASHSAKTAESVTKLSQDVPVMQKDVTGLQKDVSTVQSDVKDIRKDVTDAKATMVTKTELSQNHAALQSAIHSVFDKTNSLSDKVQQIQLDAAKANEKPPK